MTCGTLDHWAYKEKVFAFDTWHLPVSQDLTWGCIIALHIAWHWCHTLHHVLSIFPLFFFHVHVLSCSLLCAVQHVCGHILCACDWIRSFEAFFYQCLSSAAARCTDQTCLWSCSVELKIQTHWQTKDQPQSAHVNLLLLLQHMDLLPQVWQG